MVNCTKILHKVFSYKSQTSSSSVMNFRLDLLGRKEIGAKIAQKMLAKLTTMVGSFFRCCREKVPSTLMLWSCVEIISYVKMVLYNFHFYVICRQFYQYFKISLTLVKFNILCILSQFQGNSRPLI